MSNIDKIDKIYADAYDKAFSLMESNIIKVLPKGWTLYNAVGWGLSVSNAENVTVYGSFEDTHESVSIDLLKTIEDMEYFIDVFGSGNEKIVGIV